MMTRNTPSYWVHNSRWETLEDKHKGQRPHIDPNAIPTNWPDHLDEAIRQLNDHILPALNATPCELLFALPFRPDRAVPLVALPTTPTDTHINFTLAETFHADAHLLSLRDAERRKTSFDTHAPITTFKIGDLVQVYDSASDFNHKSINKLTPKWSKPRLIYGEFSNSFSLCTTTGIPLKGLFHSRRMHHFIPLCGSHLDIAHLRDNEPQPEANQAIAEAEEKMFKDLTQNSSKLNPPTADEGL
ncbi:hypothetical protein CVT25_001042 [Psilocybe cyanescens]|uniref:Uncharacterized protein n=1 Tax=Psilocybe cyanescens TaxID=93625 RepID=A0A409XK84_PSICY|nr:hypothetical protein CVT25_001042 [Psilocybe cyanescens]